jgi:serine protease Do
MSSLRFRHRNSGATSVTLVQALIGDAPAQIAEQLGRSVVQVASRGHGHGAGTIWRADGIVVTNHHVAPGDHNEVRLADGRTLPTTTLARDPLNDLAVLRVEARDLPAVAVGDARALRVGELVIAVGHPFGVRGAVTVGMVNALPYLDEGGHGRQIVQADVLLGPGNSGGPLANARGAVVGINAMVAGGLGLAVPSFLVERMLNGQPERATIGIQAQGVALPAVIAARAGTERGALVLAVAPGSPAEAAGLLLGDLIVAVDGHPIAGADGLARALGAANGVVRLGLLRGGEPREVVVLPARPTERAA